MGRAYCVREAFVTGEESLVLFKLQALYVPPTNLIICFWYSLSPLNIKAWLNSSSNYQLRIGGIFQIFFLCISLSNGKYFCKGKCWQWISCALFCKTVSNLIPINAHMGRNPLQIDIIFCRESAKMLQDCCSSSAVTLDSALKYWVELLLSVRIQMEPDLVSQEQNYIQSFATWPQIIGNVPQILSPKLVVLNKIKNSYRGCTIPIFSCYSYLKNNTPFFLFFPIYLCLNFPFFPLFFKVLQ